MKILIINPPYHQAIIREGRCQSPQNMRKTSIPQMTLAYLAGMLKQGKHDLRVYDCIADDISREKLFLDLDIFQPRLALINTTTPSIVADLLFIKLLKTRYPDCFTSVFGTHVTITHDEIMQKHSYVDCVISHEPEWSSLELAELLENNCHLDAVPGCTIRVNGDLVSVDREMNPDLDSLGFPAWEHFRRDHYIHPVLNKPYLTVNTSRGCVHNCIFCVGNIFYGKKVRFRSVESIADELENHVIGKFGIHLAWFYADDFTRSPEYVKALCREIIKRKIKITWWTNTRVDKYDDEEMFRLMKQAGCFMLSIGGESGCDQILKKIKKGTRPEFIKQTVAVLRKVGINSLVYFLIGLPGETRETITKTIGFAKEINPDYVEFYPATPYPGTEFYEIAKTENLLTHENWDKYMCGGNEFVVQIPGIKNEELNELLRKAFKEFYFRPAYAWTFLKRAVRPTEFIRLLSFGYGYFLRFITDSSKTS